MWISGRTSGIGDGSVGNGRTPPRRPQSGGQGVSRSCMARSATQFRSADSLPYARCRLRIAFVRASHRLTPVRAIAGTGVLRPGHGADQFDVLRQRDVGARQPGRSAATRLGARLAHWRRPGARRIGLSGLRVAWMIRIRPLDVAVRRVFRHGLLRDGRR